MWQSVRDGDEVMVVFRGDEAYVSPNWYPSKQEAHRQVPTWNYQVVHVHGRIHIRQDETFLRGLLARLTRTHEANAGQSPPWRMTVVRRRAPIAIRTPISRRRMLTM